MNLDGLKCFRCGVQVGSIRDGTDWFCKDCEAAKEAEQERARTLQQRKQEMAEAIYVRAAAANIVERRHAELTLRQYAWEAAAAYFDQEKAR